MRWTPRIIAFVVLVGMAAALPGVQAAGAISGLPLSDDGSIAASDAGPCCAGFASEIRFAVV